MDRFALIAPALVAVAAWVGTELTREIHRPEWGDGQAEVLFLGSSRTRDGITLRDRDDLAVRKIVFPCLDLHTAIAALEEHRERFPHLRDVVFEVSDFSLLADVVIEDPTSVPGLCAALDLDANRLPDHGSSARSRSLWLDTLAGRGLVTNHPSRRINLDLSSEDDAQTEKTKRREKKRRLARTRLTNSADQFAEARIRYARGLFRDADYARAAVTKLLALVDELDAEDVRVWCLVPPVTTAYREAMPAEWSEIGQECLARIRAHDGMQGRVLDLVADADFEDLDFFDVDHLDDPGARKMTERVLNAIAVERASALAAPR